MELLNFFDNDEQLYNAIIHAFDQLYHFDYYLISHTPNDKKRKRSWSKKTNVSERAIVFRFAHYLQNELFVTNYKLFNLDCEYNRNGDKPKKICALGKNAIPDIILHRRGDNSNNILIMEFKGYWNKDQEDDIKKIEAFVSDDEGYNFKYGIAALIDIDHVKLTMIDKKQQYEFKWKNNPFLTSF